MCVIILFKHCASCGGGHELCVSCEVARLYLGLGAYPFCTARLKRFFVYIKIYGAGGDIDIDYIALLHEGDGASLRRLELGDRAAARGGLDDPAMVFIRLELGAHHDLLEIGDACDVPCLLPGLAQCGQQHRRQDGDDGDDDEQFNQSKSLHPLSLLALLT